MARLLGMVFLAVLAVVAVSGESLNSLYSADGPPPGPANTARCPVTGTNISIASDTPSVAFKNGQKLYFESETAAAAYERNPRAYWLSPFESPLPMPDGARGLPDLRGTTVRCPYSNESFLVGMKSMRVDHRYGQAVYFCCNGCTTSFWKDPQSAFAKKAQNQALSDSIPDPIVKATMGPPPGPNNSARCPVTGVNLTITSATPFVAFKNGQRLYFASKVSASAYSANAKAYWLSPFESPLPAPDGPRGLPDLRGSTVHCPYSNEEILVGMKSVRVVHRYGQAVYFCCHGCIASFWSNPQSSFADLPSTGMKSMLV